jgi:hypothetical protein
VTLFGNLLNIDLVHLRDLEREATESLHSVGTHELNAETGEWRRGELPQTPALNALEEYESTLRQAELSFREWLDTDGPTAFNLDPITHEWLRLSRRWTHNLPRTFTLVCQEDSTIIVGKSPGNFLPGIDEDFVSPNDIFSHGPSDAQLNGVLLRVFFDKDEFEIKLAELDGPGVVAGKAPQVGQPTIKRPGRKPKFDWDDAKAFARKEWDKRGGSFNNFDTGWKGSADLERLVAEYMLKHDPAGEPAHSTLGEYIRNWISEFEAGN